MTPSDEHARASNGRVAGPAGRSNWWALSFVAAQLLLGLALAARGSGRLATVHAALTVVAAVYLTFRAPQRWAAPTAAYVVASEVLWRMTNASIPWEGAKYACSFLLVVAVWRMGSAARLRPLPLLYLLALLPSVLIVLGNPKLGPTQVDAMLSSNLSGPLTLAISAWCLSQLTLDEADTDRVLLALGGPLLSIGVVTLVRTVTAVDLTFTRGSNFATSGGFGPNQVSSALGLGALVALAVAFRSRAGSIRSWAGLALTLFFVVQSALTFSRGGLYGAGIGAAAMIACMLRSPSRGLRRIAVVLPVLLLAGAVVLSRVDAVTDGALAARFSDDDPTGRDGIMAEDLRIWGEHAVFGVGPGGAQDLRQTESTMTHTEYTRLLAEHGAFGVVALGMLAAMSAGVLLRGLRSADAAINVGMVMWSLTSMAHASMRIAVFGFVFGLAHARFAASRSMSSQAARRVSPRGRTPPGWAASVRSP